MTPLFDQAGFFVGVPYQLFSTPSPYFQLSKLRWLVACLIMMLYINMLLMPGTLGYLLAFMFEQVRLQTLQARPSAAEGGAGGGLELASSLAHACPQNQYRSPSF